MVDSITKKSYSILYAAPNQLSNDSPVFRLRVARKIFSTVSSQNANEAYQRMRDEMGVYIEYNPEWIFNWEKAFATWDIRKVLDSITEIHSYIKEKYNNPSKNKKFVDEVNRILMEEFIAYWADEFGVVHPKPDEAFQAAHSSAIKGLQAMRLNAAIEQVEKSDQYVIGDPPDWPRAIYSVFLACENVFKLITGTGNLGYKNITNSLEPMLNGRYSDSSGDIINFQSATIKAFKSWVEAAHNYRHDLGKPEPSAPPTELALLSISHGYGYVRWLADIYSWRNASDNT